MQAPRDPARLTPLIRGLPDTLKIFAAKVQDRLHTARALNNANTSRGRAPGQQSPVTSWYEFVQELASYGHQIGWISSSVEKLMDRARRVCQLNTPRSKFNERFNERPKFDKEWCDLWRQARELGVLKCWLRGASRDDIHKLVQSLTGARKNSRNEGKQPQEKFLHQKEHVPSSARQDLIDMIESMAKPPNSWGEPQATLPRY